MNDGCQQLFCRKRAEKIALKVTFYTLDVLKLLRSRDSSPEQPLNIACILDTLAVSKLLTLSDCRLEQL